eukprot:jgi/Botrbrau1/7252/Bobra.0021s0034.1
METSSLPLYRTSATAHYRRLQPALDAVCRASTYPSVSSIKRTASELSSSRDSDCSSSGREPLAKKHKMLSHLVPGHVQQPFFKKACPEASSMSDVSSSDQVTLSLSCDEGSVDDILNASTPSEGVVEESAFCVVPVGISSRASPGESSKALSKCRCNGGVQLDHDHLVPLDEEALSREKGIFDFDWLEKHGDYPPADSSASSSCQPDEGTGVKSSFYRWRPAHRARSYMFDKYSIRLGTLYFKRLAARVPEMLMHARESPDYRLLVRDVELTKDKFHTVGLKYLRHRPSAWLHLIHLTCVYVAAKTVHYVPSRQMLANIISHAMRIRLEEVEQRETEALELEVLECLDWRLSPYVRPYVRPVDSAEDYSAQMAQLLVHLAGRPPALELLAA